MTGREQLLRHYAGQREQTDRRVAEGIEKNRKGNAVLKFVDGSGKPVQGVRVKATLKNHAFLHGANLYELDQLETPEKNAIYREKYKEVFNAATVPIYWAPLEPEQGKPRYARDSSFIYRRPPIDLCLEYCEENGIRPKAHCLNYFQRAHYPDWMPEAVEEAKPLIEAHFADLAQHYSRRIPDWEVINETLCKGHRKQNTAYFKAPELVEWNFALAEKYFTANKLIINEATHIWEKLYCYDRSPYYLQIERALSKGARIDSIVMQFHNFVRAENEAETAVELYNPAHLYEVLDTYARLNKPIQLTEVTIPAYTDSEEDEALQAELLENLYRIWFSHPATEAIIYWNLVDGYAAFAPQGDMSAGENYYRGGLLRFDMSVKPAYTAIQNLFEKEWRTDISVQTNAEGKATFRGFYGAYDAEIAVDGQTITKQIHLRKGVQNQIQITL